MKKVDPTIEIAIVGYGWFRLCLGEILEITGQHIDYVVDRAIGESALREDLALIRAYNGRHGTRVRLCNTEWPAPEDDVPRNVDGAALERITTAKGRRRCWYSALNVAKTLLTFQRLGGEFAFSNFNNFANTWGQNLVECAKETAYLSPAGHVFELLSRSPAARPLELEVNQQDESVVFQAAWNESRTALCLIVINYGRDDISIDFTLEQLGREFSSCALTVMQADSLTSYNTPYDRCIVERTDSSAIITHPGEFRTMAPRFSLVHAVLK